ncbi:MAG: DUF1697 domain-containing protein [Pseudorhodobacter sp.]|nr:DUF1697 domain-containing protein [Pseudorhodobacter sp.]
MPQIWILLVRGVNVGGANRLPMADFRALLTGLGLDEVQTWIQSGNAVFRSALAAQALERMIGDAIAARFGFRPLLFLRTLVQIESILAADPFAGHDGAPTTRHVFVLAQPAPEADLAALRDLVRGEDFALTDAALYLSAPHGIGRSALVAALPRFLKVATTARNLKTLGTIAALARSLG